MSVVLRNPRPIGTTNPNTTNLPCLGNYKSQEGRGSDGTAESGGEADALKTRKTPPPLRHIDGLRQEDTMTRHEIESLLDSHQLQINSNLGLRRWYDCRRAGRTRTWKSRPDEFLIPVRVGISPHTIHITHNSSWGLRARPSDFNPRTRQ